MLGRALKMAFWVTYDHVGKLIAANLLAVGVMLAPLTLLGAGMALDPPLVGPATAITVIGLILTFAAPTVFAGLAHMAKELIETQDGSVRTMVEGMRLYWRRASLLAVGFWLTTSALSGSIWFYPRYFKESAPWLGYALSGLAASALVFTGLTGLIAIPALVQKKSGVRATAGLAALLVLNKPLFIAGLATQLVALSVLLLVLPPVAILLYFSAAVVLLTTAYEQLSRHYALEEYTRTGELDQELYAHVHIVTRDGRAQVDDEQDDYLNRGLRDALFPWKD